jgi:hypothetical protein
MEEVTALAWGNRDARPMRKEVIPAQMRSDLPDEVRTGTIG